VFTRSAICNLFWETRLSSKTLSRPKKWNPFGSCLADTFEKMSGIVSQPLEKLTLHEGGTRQAVLFCFVLFCF
jgi:hypothetical protein